MNKEDFPILNQDIVYLDNAATTQKPYQVIDAISSYYKELNANIDRGAYKLSIKATQIYNEAKNEVAKFINALSNEIIFTKNATESINLVAYSYVLNELKKGDEIVLSIMEHHSNLVPWQILAKKVGAKLVYLYLNDDYSIDEKEYKKITSKTKLVLISHISNVTGTINPVKKIIKIAHSFNSKVLVDATQSTPHIKIDVKDMDADFLVFSSHKMLGPMGIGVLYAKEEILNNMNPFIMGGDMIDYVYEEETVFSSYPRKFEAGTANVEAAYGLCEAIKYLNKIGMEKIEKYEKELLQYTRNELEKLDFIETYYPKDINKHSSVISFNIKNIHSHDTATLLDMDNICIRSGNHCAQPLLRSLKINSTARISLYFYNTKEDIDKLVISLKKINEKFSKYIKEN